MLRSQVDGWRSLKHRISGHSGAPLQAKHRDIAGLHGAIGNRQVRRLMGSTTAAVRLPEHGGGARMPEHVQARMETVFGVDLSPVRIHEGPYVDAIGALAYTRGTDIHFSPGQYQPNSLRGQELLGHELTHVVQQSQQRVRATAQAKGLTFNDDVSLEREADAWGAAAAREPGPPPGIRGVDLQALGPAIPGPVQRYTDAERREMAEGRVVGQANDIAMATQRGFQSGDIVFRLGSTALGFLSGNPVSHGGIYIGNGLIHDAVGFGNRHVRVANFFDPALGEAADRNTFRVVRFRGPHRDLILARLLDNIRRRDFRMPTDPVPFNLFSSADDYRTATCLEYAHAQFLYAIRQLSADTTVPEVDRQSLRATYFAGNAVEPNALIRPQVQTLIGNTPDLSATGMHNGPLSPPPTRTPSAMTQQALLIAAATALATDVDPRQFANRGETQYVEHWPGGSGIGGTILNAILGSTHDEVILRTFTYRSFVDSRRFFQDVTPSSAPATP